MRRPTFSVTGGVVCALVAIGAFRVIFQPLLPPSTTGYLITPSSGERVPGAVVEVNWQRTIEEGLAAAKKAKKPMLVFLADPANMFAKQLELGAFRDAELARFVNRHFMPIKINLDDKPEWASILDSAVSGFQFRDPGCRLIVLDQTGRPTATFAIDQGTRYLGYENVLRFLVESSQKLDDLIGTPNQETLVEQQKSQEMQALEAVLPNTEIKYDQFLVNVFSKRDPVFDIPTDAGFTRLNPSLIRLLAKIGHISDASRLLYSTIKSPLYDVLDGGFYRSIISFPTPKVDISKSAVQIANMAEVLAQLTVAYPQDPLPKELLKQTLTCIRDDFTDELGISGFRLNDQNEIGISVRSSVTLARLNQALTREERDLFFSKCDTQTTHLQDIAFLKRAEDVADPKLQAVFKKLRDSAGERPGLTSSDKTTVLGNVAARLFTIYAITGDEAVRQFASELSDKVYQLVTDKNVYRRYGFPEQGDGWLGSYLAVADCGLSEYAATGNIYALRHGRTALRLTINKFRDERSGFLGNVSAEASVSLPIERTSFEFADSHREGLNTVALRLSHLYAKLSVTAEERKLFQSFAYGQFGRLGGLLGPTAIHCAGFFDAAFDVQRDATILIYGTDYPAKIHQVASAVPFLPILPAIPGESAPSGKKADGVYLLTFRGLEGPISIAELKRRF